MLRDSLKCLAISIAHRHHRLGGLMPGPCRSAYIYITTARLVHRCRKACLSASRDAGHPAGGRLRGILALSCIFGAFPRLGSDEPVSTMPSVIHTQGSNGCA
ncbi:hypothetical protein GCM10010446_66560 [Streptomyces enissocaesilis]|uniref:Uncharacterized protein n=1 Tax=Streptomyces enissocaesilis TaxID=332589 RepID=A0ABN3XPU7_9ACTN